MNRASLSTLLAAFVLALAILAGVQWLGWLHSQRMQELLSLVGHTYRVQAARNLLLADILSVEIGQRSYVLTGQPTFLEMFEESVARTDADMRLLKEVTMDPQQVASLAALEPLVAERLAFARRTVDLRSAGRGDLATQEVATLRGKELTDRIRARLDLMAERSQALLEQRAEAAEEQARKSRLVMLAGTVVSLTLLLVALVLAAREHGRRRHAERELRAHRDALEARVRERTEALQQSRARLSFALQASQIGAWRLDLKDRTATRTPIHDRIFGYDALLSEWTYEMFLEHVLPEERAEVDRTFQAALESETNLKLECRIRRADGEIRWILVGGGLERTEAGTPVAMSGIIQDLTDRRVAEEALRRLNVELDDRVKQRTRELEEANKDLEAFSYSVSHDLRAPLRHVQGYVEMLQQTSQAQLSEKACRYLATIAQASQEMGRLIDGLLHYARVGRVSFSAVPVSLDALVKSAIQDLEPATRGRNVTWNVHPLPKVLGDPSLLRQVFANLIGNAVKYSQRRDPAVVTVGQQDAEDGRVTVFVRDNGAGFDMRYVDRLFGVFQRLHRAEEFEGTGIGLATVQRIVTRHGGRAWAEGKLGEGATFYVTLAPAESAEPRRGDDP